MIASMVARELRGEQGPERPRKTSKRRSKLKQAAEKEKDAETPGERTQFLVSATHINHKKSLPGMDSPLFVNSSTKFLISQKM